MFCLCSQRFDLFVFIPAGSGKHHWKGMLDTDTVYLCVCVHVLSTESKYSILIFATERGNCEEDA